MTGNDDCPHLEPANPCDAIIENEFPESDASLEIEILHFDAELERTHNWAPTVLSELSVLLSPTVSTTLRAVSTTVPYYQYYSQSRQYHCPLLSVILSEPSVLLSHCQYYCPTVSITLRAVNTTVPYCQYYCPLLSVLLSPTVSTTLRAVSTTVPLSVLLSPTVSTTVGCQVGEHQHCYTS